MVSHTRSLMACCVRIPRVTSYIMIEVSHIFVHDIAFFVARNDEIIRYNRYQISLSKNIQDIRYTHIRYFRYTHTQEVSNTT